MPHLSPMNWLMIASLMWSLIFLTSLLSYSQMPNLFPSMKLSSSDLPKPLWTW